MGFREDLNIMYMCTWTHVYVYMYGCSLTYALETRDHHCHPPSLSTIFFVETWSYCLMLAGQPVPRFSCFSISPSSGTADVGHCKWFLCEFSILIQHHLLSHIPSLMWNFLIFSFDLIIVFFWAPEIGQISSRNCHHNKTKHLNLDAEIKISLLGTGSWEIP